MRYISVALNQRAKYKQIKRGKESIWTSGTRCSLVRMHMQTMEKEKIITGHMGFAHYMAGKYADCGIEREELISTAYLGLVKAAESYDPSKGFRFTSYSSMVMRNEIGMYLRRMKHLYRETSYETEIPGTEGMRIVDTLGYEQPEYERFERCGDLCMIMKTALSDREYKVIDFIYYQNKGQKEVGAMLGISQAMVSKIHQSGLKKLRKELEK